MKTTKELIAQNHASNSPVLDNTRRNSEAPVTGNSIAIDNVERTIRSLNMAVSGGFTQVRRQRDLMNMGQAYQLLCIWVGAEECALQHVEVDALVFRQRRHEAQSKVNHHLGQRIQSSNSGVHARGTIPENNRVILYTSDTPDLRTCIDESYSRATTGSSTLCWCTTGTVNKYPEFHLVERVNPQLQYAHDISLDKVFHTHPHLSTHQSTVAPEHV